MNEEDRRRLLEQLGLSSVPITTTRYTAPYTAPYAAPYTAPFYGLTASDENLQDVTPFSTVSTEPAPIHAGMAQVGLPLAQQPLSQGVVDSLQHTDAWYGGETIPSPKDAEDRRIFKEVVEKLPTTGWMGDVSNWAISKVMQHGIPFTGFSGDDIETATTAEGMTDVLNNLVVLDAKKAGIPKDDLIASIVSGVNPLIQSSEDQLAAAEDYVSQGGKLDKDDARQMAFQVDEFVDLVPATTPSTISKVSRPSTKKAAIGTKKNEAEEREKARMRTLAKQQADSQRKRDAAKAQADKVNAAAVQAAIQRAAQASAEREMVSKAQALMSKYGGRREPAENYMSTAERDIVAAANVDTFAGMGDRSGEVREAMRSVGYGGPEWT